MNNMIKIKMSVAPRLITLANLPENGSMYDLIIKRQIRNLIDLSSEETTLLEMKQLQNGVITWNNQIDSENIKEYELTQEQVDFLIKIYDKLDKEGKLVDGILDFVVELFSHKIVEDSKPEAK